MVTAIHNFTPAQAEELRVILANESSFFIVCTGFTTEQADQFTVAYKREFSSNWISLQRATRHVDSTVIIYVDRLLLDAVLVELDYIPTVIVVAEEVYYTKLTKKYLHTCRVPLVRITSKPTAVVELSKDDYYNGVCATLLASEAGDSAVVCPTLDYALLVSLRLNEDVIRKQTKAREEASGSDTTAIPVEAPESEFTIDPDDKSSRTIASPGDSGTDLPRVTVPSASAALFKPHGSKLAPLASSLLYIALVSLLVSGCI